MKPFSIPSAVDCEASLKCLINWNKFCLFCRANEVVIVKRSDDEIGLTDEVLLDDSLKWCQKSFEQVNGTRSSSVNSWRIAC